MTSHLLVSHGLASHVVWLPLHLRSTSSMVLWVCISKLTMGHIMGRLVSFVSRCMPSHLTMMSRMWSHSAHSVQLLVVSWLRDCHSSLQFFPLSLLCSSLLLCSQVFSLLLLVFIKIVTNFSNMINFRVSTVKFIILVGTLHILIPLLLCCQLCLVLLCLGFLILIFRLTSLLLIIIISL